MDDLNYSLMQWKQNNCKIKPKWGAWMGWIDSNTNGLIQYHARVRRVSNGLVHELVVLGFCTLSLVIFMWVVSAFG